MAQIFGYFRAPADGPAAEVLRGFGQRLRRPTQGPPEIWSAPEGGLGAVLTREQGAFSAVEQPPEVVVAIDGWLATDAQRDLDPAIAVAERYFRRGADFACDLRGSYAIAIYDSRARRLLLACDRLSTRAMFWTRLPNGLAFGSELKGFLALPNWAARVDPQAIACYLRYGRLFGRRTMCRDVQLLLPGKTLVYDVAGDSTQEHTSSSLESVVHQRQPLTKDRLDSLAEAFARGVAKGCHVADSRPTANRDSGKVGLSLSGGLDSRGILAVLAAQKTKTFLRTEGLEGCMDQRVAARLASETGFPWCFQPLRTFDIDTYVEATRRYVYLTEGMLVPEGFPGIGPIRFADEEKLSVLQRGHGGENARVGDAWPFQVKSDVLALKTMDQLADRLELESAQPNSDHTHLFADEGIARAIAQPEDTLSGFARSINGSLTPAETMSLMYLRINDGGQVTAFRNCLRGYTDMALPYLDDEFLDLVLGTRVSDRLDETIHHHLVHRHCPALMRVPNSNHGAPLNASKVRRLVTGKMHAVFRKLHLPGFRHYHDVEAWIQNSLRQSVQSFLLDTRSVERGLVSESKLRAIIQDPNLAGRPRLLARLVTIEMWLRQFQDRELDRYQLCLN